MPNMLSRSSCSAIWRAITDVWPTVTENITWSLQNGSSIRFWKEQWIPGMPSISELCNGVIPENQAGLTVSYFVQEGNWRWDLLE